MLFSMILSLIVVNVGLVSSIIILDNGNKLNLMWSIPTLLVGLAVLYSSLRSTHCWC
jgi:hypothetical protein